jgi:hypothetical protein
MLQIPMLEGLTYGEMLAMPDSVRTHYLAALADDDYRLLMAMVVYHRRRKQSFLDDRTITGLVVEGRIRRTRSHEMLERGSDHLLATHRA